jgi:hypothetical protein
MTTHNNNDSNIIDAKNKFIKARVCAEINRIDPYLQASNDAARLADDIIDSAVAVLRRSFPNHSTQTLELLLADVRSDAVANLGDFAEQLVDGDAP